MAVVGVALGAAAVTVGGQLMLQPPQVAVADSGWVPTGAVQDDRDAPEPSDVVGRSPGAEPASVHASAPAQAAPESHVARGEPPTASPVPDVGAPPATLRVPGLEILADVLPVGVGTSGALEVPANGDVVGWWSSGAAPGAAAGSVVLAGHVDTAAGAGLMASVLTLPMGSVVEVVDDGGRVTTYRVVARRAFGKDEGLPRELFDVDGPPQLVLITCGGTFDARTGHYSDNVVVHGEPV